MGLDIKKSVLGALEAQKGRYISGAALARELYVSRNAVWKAVAALRAEGFDVSAAPNRGYRLSPDSDILSAAAIERYLGPDAPAFDVSVYDTVDSTNTRLRQLATGGAREGTVVAAARQTGGRGRQGRGFYSPAGTGVYFSLLLRPCVRAEDATLITAAAAVAVAEAIDAVAGVPAAIKWVNDVFVGGRKVCGILTEGAFDMESGGLEYAVLGVGINVAPPPEGFPEDIAGTAGAVFGGGPPEPGARARLAALVLRGFMDYYADLPARRFLPAYRARSLVIGNGVDVLAGDATRRARALDIDDDCRLVVEYEDGSVEALSAGEVRVRPLQV